MVASAVAEQFYLGFRQRHVMRAMNANVKLGKSRQLPPETTRNELVIDVGGTHIKVYPNRSPPTDKDRLRSCHDAEENDSGCSHRSRWLSVRCCTPRLPRPGRAWEATSQSCESWRWLGWVGFDFQKAFASPTQVVNDAAIQTLGSYRGGCMLFLGLGTGLGSALIVGVSDSQGPGIPGVPTATGAPGARRGATF
jgi:polyphosphate glucokinase